MIAEIAQSTPISGIIVSVGPECKLSRLGDRVMYSRFAGHNWDHRGGESTTMLREAEVLSWLTENPFES